MRSRSIALFLLLSTGAAAQQSADEEHISVRVVERGTHRPIAKAIVECQSLEVRVFDNWIHRVVGDDLFHRKSTRGDEQAATTPGTASTWISSGGGKTMVCDETGVAKFEGEFYEGATLVASTKELRGAKVVLSREDRAADTPIEVEVGPRRLVEVLVVGPDELPRAGVPVEFGRFLRGAESRQRGDGEELWDSLGATALTDEQGRARLWDLEIHGADDLDVLRGCTASAFCVRAVVVGSARVTVDVDPDAPPDKAVVLHLPACGTLNVMLGLLDGTVVESDGELEAFSRAGSFAPGFQRYFDVQRGRATIFPVEIAPKGAISFRSDVFEDGQPTARVILLGGVGSPILSAFGDSSFPKTVQVDASGPTDEKTTSEVHLALPTTWFQARARLLKADRTPITDVEIDCVRTLTPREPQKYLKPGELRRRASLVRTDSSGVLRFLSHRPTVDGDFGIEFVCHEASNVVTRKRVALSFGQNPWNLDLGDVVLEPGSEVKDQ